MFSPTGVFFAKKGGSWPFPSGRLGNIRASLGLFMLSPGALLFRCVLRDSADLLQPSGKASRDFCVGHIHSVMLPRKRGGINKRRLPSSIIISARKRGYHICYA